MSFLTPLYIAGALAVSLPIVFHLIRRTPRGETAFSSLMFLTPSPPRITRRSRIEHWLLLALRGLSLLLLALAFARPFWRQPAQAGDADATQQRVAIVVDTSASMRRENLWQQAVAAADAAVAACRPQDQVGVFVSDETLRPIASFEDLAQVPPQQRRAVVSDRLRGSSPTWASTHTGQALVDAAALVNESHDATEAAGRAARRIVLISDMQVGSRLNVLGDTAWPDDVSLELHPVRVTHPTNAGLWRLADAGVEEQEAAAGRGADALRVRVTNAPDSIAEQYQLTWMDSNGNPLDAAVDAYVPPGESRVVRVPTSTSDMVQPQLVLSGDDCAFDNSLYIVSGERKTITVGYLGADRENDPEGLRYYAEHAIAADPSRDVRVVELSEIDRLASQAPPLIVVTQSPRDDERTFLKQYLAAGGTVLYVVMDVAAGAGLAALMDLDTVGVTEADVGDYTMLQEIDFGHPMFAAMAGPRFNDFTHIRFWKYRRLDFGESESVHMVARFENGDPAVVERRVGDGRVVALAAGWQPRDGQLARSWKFLLMISALLDDGEGGRDFRTNYVVNQRVPLPPPEALADRASMTRPDGVEVALPKDAQAFSEATLPGVYTIAGVKGPIRFSVNIDPVESDTSPVAAEAFEQLGCRLVGSVDARAEAERLEQLRDVELEGRQRIWQWLVAAALGLLIAETWLAGRLSQRLSPAGV